MARRPSLSARKIAPTAALVFACAALIGGGAGLASATQGAPVNTSPPTVTGTAQVGQTLKGSAGSWAGWLPMTFAYQWKRCKSSGWNCVDVAGATAPNYTLLSADIGRTFRLRVTATNSARSRRARSEATAVVTDPTPPTPTTTTPTTTTPTTTTPTTTTPTTTTPTTTTPTTTTSTTTTTTTLPPPGGTYFVTEPVGASGLPRSDAYCAGAIRHNAWEPRADNFIANHTVPSNPSAITWYPYQDYPGWEAKRAQVTGNFTGTTTEIISWGACKWGIDEDTIRAVANQESEWHENSVGDYCGVAGEGSYGIMQVKNKNCSGEWDWGGYPWTAQSTALNVDFYAAALRSCYNGDMAPDKPGKDIWGCVGSWFSGGWHDSGANAYAALVQQWLHDRTWEGY